LIVSAGTPVEILLTPGYLPQFVEQFFQLLPLPLQAAIPIFCKEDLENPLEISQKSLFLFDSCSQPALFDQLGRPPHPQADSQFFRFANGPPYQSRSVGLPRAAQLGQANQNPLEPLEGLKHFFLPGNKGNTLRKIPRCCLFLAGRRLSSHLKHST
jgi:hypothetical protein